MHYLLSVPFLKFVVSWFWWMTLVYLYPLILSSKKQIPFYAQTLLIICRCKQIPCNLIPSNDGSKDYIITIHKKLLIILWVCNQCIP